MNTKRFICITAIILLTSSSLYPCTIFMAAKGGKVLAGNNEDFIDPETNMWFLPAEDGKYGRVYFGFGIGLPQGGMNDQGLFFDYAALPPMPKPLDNQKEIYKGSLVKKAMEECKSVEEVLEIFDKYDRQYMETYQVMFGDRHGNAVIIEKDTIIAKQGDYLVCTNFRQSLNKDNPYSIERYTIADQMLRESNEISVELFRSILAKSHQDPPTKKGSRTQYSNIYDLQNGLIYLYHFHNYADVVKIDLEEELKKGEHSVEIPSLFTPMQFSFQEYAKNPVRKKYEAASIEPSVLTDLAGEYQVTVLPAMTFEVSNNGDELYCRISGFETYRIYPESENKYFFTTLDAQIEFIRNDDRKVDALTFTMYGNKLPAKRTGE